MIKRILLFVYAPMAAFYIFMSLIYPTDPYTISKRHLSYSQARVMAVFFAISMIIVWLFALYGAWRLKQYSRSIKPYKDGKAFTKLSTGIFLLAIYLPIRSLVKIVLNFLAYKYPSLTHATNLIITYVGVIFPLVAYIYISRAAQGLIAMTKAKISLKMMYVLLLAFCFMGVTFCYATYSMTDKLSPTDWLVVTDYNIPVPLRIITIIIPYLFMWCVGLIAVYEIYIYQQVVKGVVYRQSLRLLTIGLTIEILASIIMQYITTISATLQSFSTAFVLFILYSILILIAVSFVLIAKGVNHLMKLEVA